MRMLLAAACIGALCGASAAEAATKAKRPSGRTVAKRKLAREGFTSVALSCKTKKTRTRCSWTGLRHQSRCDGRVVVAPKSRTTRARAAQMDATRCRPVLYGFNTYTNERTVGLQQKTGANVRRIIVPWYSVQPGPGVWNWHDYDEQYRKALEAGFKPIIIATEAPCWARPRSGCLAPAIGGPPDPERDGDWRTYVKAVADRYPQALAIEIWNEPNLSQVWWPKPDPARYTQLLTQAYGVIKQSHPDLPVISGGLLSHGMTGEGPSGMGDLTFLRGMLAAGAGNAMDGLGVHPYPQENTPEGRAVRWNPGMAVVTLRKWRAIAAEHGVSKPLWITEIGESTSSQAGFPAAVTPDEQARDLEKIMLDAVQARDIEVVVIHTLGDAPRDAGQQGLDNLLQPATGISIFYNGVNSGFGVFDSADRPKPAACVLSRALGGTLNC
ncbi:MAG TPA: hypothetical protein VFZ89_05450 [Solirubrobacteraceae bacterium]